MQHVEIIIRDITMPPVRLVELEENPEETFKQSIANHEAAYQILSERCKMAL